MPSADKELGRDVNLRDNYEERNSQSKSNPQMFPRHSLEARVGIHDDHRVVWACSWNAQEMQHTNVISTKDWALPHQPKDGGLEVFLMSAQVAEGYQSFGLADNLQATCICNQLGVGC